MPNTVSIQNGHLLVLTDRDFTEDSLVLPKNSFSIELVVHTPLQLEQLNSDDTTRLNRIYEDSGIDTSSLLTENSEVTIRNIITGIVIFNISYKLPLTRLSISLIQEHGTIKKAGQYLQEQLVSNT